MITEDGYLQFCIWEHSDIVRDLYSRRCRREEPEMDCAAQAAELIAKIAKPGESILDVGCGSGYFYHSLAQRGLHLDYTGIDASPTLIEVGRSILPSFGLAPSKLRVLKIEDLAGSVDHVVCLNVLSNIDNFHRPLERLLHVAQKSIVLRESVDETNAGYGYVHDKYLNSDVNLRVHVNTYPLREFTAFIEANGFTVDVIEDQRTRGRVEQVIDFPHYWKFFSARRS